MTKIETPTFVKWAGGKTQLLKQFELFFPKKIDRYFEPFVGSGAVFYHIKQIYKPNYCMISDHNQDLINLYMSVRDNPERLKDLLKEYKKMHTENPKEFYYKQRNEFNKTKDNLIKSSLLIYLNKTCYNGLYRVNSKGEFNVPIGRYENPSIVQENKLNNASKLLQDTIIKAMHFERILDYTEPEDFIYLDPPYHPLSNTAYFTSYHQDAFLDKEQEQLAKIFQKLDGMGCKVMLSNSDTPFIHKLYKKYEQEGNLYQVKAKRMINRDADGRKSVNEVIVTNYKP